METILITGGAGFIGSTLANRLSKTKRVVVIDDLSMGKKSNLNNSDTLTFIEGSVTNLELMETIIKKYQFDYVYHLAAVASVADSVDRPVETHQVNFESTFLLLELIKKYVPTLKRLVFASSAAVYGDEPTLPKQEESVIRPLTPYAIDKFAGEKYVLAYNNLYNVPTSAVRFFNVYGPNQNPNSPYSGVISILVDRYKKQMAGQNEVFNIFGDGTQSRDFVYIEDVVDALILVATSPISRGEVYNVGTSTGTSLSQLIDMTNDILGTKLAISYAEGRSGDIPYSYANIDKLISIGYKSQYSVKEGLTEYLEKAMK